MPRFVFKTPVNNSPAEVAAYHESPGALGRLLPSYDGTEVVEKTGDLASGEVVFRVPAGPTKMTWRARHTEHVPGSHFIDEIVPGPGTPFKQWRHKHSFGSDGGEIVDEIDYQLKWFAKPGVPVLGKKIGTMFAWRHLRTMNDLERPRVTPKTIAIAGGTGLIGQQLEAYFQTLGHTVIQISRRAGVGVQWDPAKGELDESALRGVDVVINLAGHSVAGGRWNEENKRKIIASRVASTKLLAETMAGMDGGPKTLINASAVGYYGTGEELRRELNGAGDDFLATVCDQWEKAAKPAIDAGLRVVFPRIGVVLSARGGALKQMLTPFKMGAGGKVGSGKQWFPWIAMDDMVGAMAHLVESDIEGPVNLAAPYPVRQLEFAKTLGRVLRRPAIAPLPSFVVKAMFGEMGEVILLRGQQVSSDKLQNSGYKFLHEDLESALRFELGKLPPLTSEE